jgi:hypothetical protein
MPQKAATIFPPQPTMPQDAATISHQKATVPQNTADHLCVRQAEW